MISGTITLKDGSTIEVNDDNIVSGSVKYSMSTSTGGQFDIGTFNASRLKIGIFDEQSAGREFDAAEIKLFEGEGENQVATGIYYVDGTQTDRRGKVVKLVAYDAAVKFDVEKVVEADGGTSYYSTAKHLIAQICEKVGVDYVDYNNDDFVNVTYSINLAGNSAINDRAITTCRDMVMWICKMICANAVINREGKLEIRKAKYTADGEEIAVDHTFTADDRENIEFSDIRTYIKYLTAYINDDSYVDGGNIEFTSSYTSTDAQARAAAFSLSQNPMYNSHSSFWAKNWLDYIDSFKQREIKATVFDGVKVQLGDTCRFSGGKIDIGRRIIGVVTDIERTYNGKTVIICRAPKAVETEVEKGEESS